MHQHVEEREFDLAHGLHAALVVAGGDQAVIERARQGLARVHVRGQLLHHGPFPAEVLHELRGQFDGVPLHAGKCRRTRFVHFRQQRVQRMAGFVEQGDDVVVRQHGGAVAVGAREVAGQVDHGRLHVARDHAASAFAVDPGAALLSRTRIQVQVQIADQAAIRAFNAHAARIAVPGGDGRFGQAHVEQFFNDVEQAGQHAGFGEVLLHFIFGIGIARFAQAFRRKCHVPGLQLVQAQFAGGVGLEFGQVTLRERFGARGQVAQEFGDFAGVARHAGLQAQRCVGAQAQQAGFLGAQGQQFFDQRRIVELGFALFGGHGAIATVQRFAQGAVLRVLHDGQVARHFQGQLPTRLAVFFGGGAGG
ncbi:hypothetical protein D3C72_1135820 [compost metagenome]